MHPLTPCGAPAPLATTLPAAGRAAETTRSFGTLLNAPPTQPQASPAAGPLRPITTVDATRAAEGLQAPQALVDVLTRIRRDERALERHLRRALSGHNFSLPQLVALQSLAFRYSQQVELLGKVVDRLTGAVKQTLQLQV